MTRLDINAARCEALFSSGLQESDALTAASVSAAIAAAVRRFGIGGCVCLMAQEFGDHPVAARSHEMGTARGERTLRPARHRFRRGHPACRRPRCPARRLIPSCRP